ncbi:PAXNEB-domain-containing protein [Aulographum hederae CBS 113979]|uniref:Elongator complex protein 4 n=1 Tax=Aulographum hederae CBS 113979 TaxID=1176131 RepID=A0A6G1GN60_9PEZI|nr:PAXNEB-domain-containing protein [Aulographum hederae CBS 113979]
MSFRKRNTAITRSVNSDKAPTPSAASAPGVRTSPLTGNLTISTGCSSLDSLLAAHAGLVLGNSLLIEESGTTDYSGVLLKLFAAEGIVQQQHVHVVGVGEGWGRELPGLVEEKSSRQEDRESKSKGNVVTNADDKAAADRMKIAWRYERLGQHGESKRDTTLSRASLSQEPPSEQSLSEASAQSQSTFCHTFDLAKRLIPPSESFPIKHIPIPSPSKPSSTSFLLPILDTVSSSLLSSSPTVPHRLIIPTLLSPFSYPALASSPSHLIPFLHGLRALMRAHPNRLTVLLSLPLSLYPRTSGLVRLIETLCDGVLELQPFPHEVGAVDTGTGKGKDEEKPQGLLKVYKLPIFSERGGGAGRGVGEGGEDLAFVLSRRKFRIVLFDLPPVDGEEGQDGGAKDLEF